MTTNTTELHKDTLLYGLRSRMTDEQEEMVSSILNNRLTIVNAISGAGKTTIAVAMAKYLFEKDGQEAIYITSTVEEGALGHTPGSVTEKELKYFSPLFDALQEVGEQDPLSVIQFSDDLIGSNKQWIQAKSHSYMRGTNIKERTVIIEEAQNLKRSELKKILTRIHDDCTVIMIGHSKQVDLPKGQVSGFEPYTEHLRKYPFVGVVELTKDFRGELARASDAFDWD